MKIKLLDFGAIEREQLPVRKHYNDAGADIFAARDWNLAPGMTFSFPLGFGVEIPDGYAGYIVPRSGLSARGIVCQLPPIDSSYRGEVHAIVSNLGRDSFHIDKGSRIGQLVIMPCLIADFVTELPDGRGEGAFGSTGQ